jgi:hypothetical protein
MEHEALYEQRFMAAKPACQPADRMDGTSPIHIQTFAGHARALQDIDEGSWFIKTEYSGLPPVLIQRCCERNERAFGTANIQIRNHKCDWDWLIWPGAGELGVLGYPLAEALSHGTTIQRTRIILRIWNDAVEREGIVRRIDS